MPNNDQTWQQAAQFVTSCFLRVYQQQQQQYILNIWKNLSFKPKHALLKSGIDTEKKRAQNLVDQVFEYVAPSLFVTSVLASGELVGSTIWGISKYVSKDIIYNTFGATTAAVILQSAELVGYRNEVQEFFGIKPAEKRATVAIKMGSKLGQAIGAVAGTSLTLLAEPWILPVAPVLAPYLPFAGLFIGGVAGEVIGAGLGAGLNNLLLSTIGIVPASYKGIKQKGGKFVERIQNSRAEKRKVKEAKAAQKVKREDKKEDQKNAAPVNEQGTGAPNASSAQKLLEGGGVQAPQLNPNTALVVPFVLGVKPNLSELPGVQAVVGQQRNTARNTPANEIPGEGGNKTVVGNPKSQEAVGQSARKKKPGEKNLGNREQETTSLNNSGKKTTAAQTKVKKTVTQLSQPIAPKSQGAKPKNSKTKTNGQSVYEALGVVVTEEGGEWQKVPTQKEKKAAGKQKKLEAEAKRKTAETQQKSQTGYSSIRLTVKTPPKQKHEVNVPPQKTKFTNDIQPKNAIGKVLKQGKNNDTSHAQNPNNRSGQRSGSSRTGRNK